MCIAIVTISAIISFRIKKAVCTINTIINTIISILAVTPTILKPSGHAIIRRNGRRESVRDTEGDETCLELGWGHMCHMN